MRKIRIPVHYCWVQGLGAIPARYSNNLRQWKAALPADFELVGWDQRLAASRFAFYHKYHASMSHPAMSADLILLHAQVHCGGVVIGTDMRPNCVEGLLERLRVPDSFAVVDRAGCIYNGMSFAAAPWDPRFVQILDCIRCAPERFAEKQVPAVTGPLRWAAILRRMDHGLELISEDLAWTRSYWQPDVTRPDAWVHPGFAASHIANHG